MNRVAAGLRARKENTTSSASGQVSRAARELRRVLRRAPDRVRLVGRKCELTQGALEGYRRSRDAMRDLNLTSGDAAFHRWRRRVKDHWYQLRLFEGLDRQARARAQRVEKLETLLGDAHNLVMLRLALLEGRDANTDARTIALILGCISKYQAWLRRSAVKLGHSLFQNSPKIMGRSVGTWARRA
jgi:hypothetical protein